MLKLDPKAAPTHCHFCSSPLNVEIDEPNCMVHCNCCGCVIGSTDMLCIDTDDDIETITPEECEGCGHIGEDQPYAKGKEYGCDNCGLLLESYLVNRKGEK